MRSASVSQSYKECQKRLLTLRKEVGDLEASDMKNESLHNVGERVNQELSEVGATLTALSKAVGSASDMDLWQKKIANAQNEQRALVAAMREVLRKRDLVKEEEDAKKALLERRYENLDSVKLDNEYKINASAGNSVSMLSQYIEMSKGAVSEFRRQRMLLESVQNRLVDAGHSMGLSSSLMAVIQRRDFVDRLIVFGGMLVFVIVIALIWWFKK